MATQFQIIFWRDIPAQVKVKQGRKKVSRPLPERFEKAIDQAAMQSGATGTDAYLEEWRRSDWEERDGDPEAVAEALVAELDETYSREVVKALVKNGGKK